MMNKRPLKLLITVVLLGSLLVQADIGGWRPSPTYTDGTSIPASDVQTFELSCNNTPEEFGPPYEIIFPNYDLAVDLTPAQKAIVSNDVAGTYWCAPTQFSTQYLTRSGFGPEQNFTVAPPPPVVRVPNPPLLL